MDKTLGKEMVATWNYNREYEGIEISFDDKPSEEIRTKMKGAGFHWSSRQMKWYAKDTAQSRKVASEIATQGEDVGGSLTFEQKMQRDKERTEQRQERLGTKVEKLEKKSESLLDQAHKMADVIPFGQPILVGHHSEGRDRRYRDKIHNKFGKGFELQDEAKAVEQRLEGSQALARKRETPGYMSRKIDKLEADLRKFEREKEQWKTAMPEWEKRTGKLKEEIAYWKKELGEVGGLKVTQADVKVGDEILYGGKWYEVVRVNPKTVTIKNWLDIPTWTWGAEYSKIKEVRHKGSPKQIYPEPEKSTTPKVHTYFFRNRPPDIGMYPEGAVMKEAWLPMRKTPKGSMAFGWVSYERELTADEIKNYELFVDLPAMPKLVAEFIKYVHDEGILEGHKEFKSEYGRAYIAWVKANNDWDSSKGDEAEFLRHLARLAGIIEWTPQQVIKLAADTVETLRKPDVFRVLNQNKAHAKELGAFIKSKRADLANEVEKILFEFTLPTYELYFWRLTHTPHLKEKWHIEYKVAEISDNKRREFSSFGSRYFETWEEIRNILASGTANLWVHDVRGDHTVTFKPVALGLPRTLDQIGKSYINGKFITQLIQPSYTYPDGMWDWNVQHEMMENGRLQSAGREIIAESVIESLPEFTEAMRNEAIIREALKSYDLSVPKDKIGRAGFILDVFPREYVPMLAKLDKVARQELEPKLMQLIQAAKDELNKPNISEEQKPTIKSEEETAIKESFPTLKEAKDRKFQLELKGYLIKEDIEEDHTVFGKPKYIIAYIPENKPEYVGFKEIKEKEKPKFTIENPFGVDLSKSVVPYPEQPKIDTQSKDYKSGYNTAILGRIYPPVPAWTDQGKAEFDAGYTEGKRVLYEQPKPDVLLFGKPIEVLPEKTRVLGAPSKQELSLKEARVKAAEGKRLKGQQTLFSAVSSSHRLDEYSEKPKKAEPLKFKRPIPVVGRMRTPPYPFIRPKPKLLAMPSEQEIQKVKQSKEAELHTRLMLIAEKTRLKREQNQLKKEVE